MRTTEDVCESCGERNPAGSAFCLFCGVYLGWNEKEQKTRDPALDEDPFAPVTTRSDRADGLDTGEPGAGTLPEVPTTPAEAPQAAEAPIQGAASGQPSCPACGQPNDPARRFCTKCGQLLRTGATGLGEGAASVVPRSGQSWWQRLRDPAGRAARRRYRRSLSSANRWRRVLFGALAVALVVGVLAVVDKNPVQWVKARWYDVTGKTVTVPGVVGRAGPQSPVPAGFDAAGLASGAPSQAWATAWSPDAKVPPQCGGGNGVGEVILKLPHPTRLRGMDISAGLALDDPDRLHQFRPHRVDVIFDGGCEQVMLDDVAVPQRESFDTGHDVSRVTLAVASTYRPVAGDVEPTRLVAISGVTLLERPE